MPTAAPVHSAARRGSRLLLLSWLATAAMLAFFAALAVGYLSRPAAAAAPRQEQSPPIPLPALLLPNSLVLICGDLALWNAGRDLLASRPAAAEESDPARAVRAMLSWLGIAFGLGCLFVVDQFIAWGQWERAGAHLARWPEARFFYLLTAAHAAHMLAGLVVLGALFAYAWRGRLRAEWPAPLSAARVFWLGLTAAWIGIYLLLGWR